MKNIKVLLAYNYNVAKEAVKTHSPKATIKTQYEFGENNYVEVKGSVIHLHDDPNYINCPSGRRLSPLSDGSTILIKSLDLDTIGGCLALMDIKPDNNVIWWSAHLTKNNTYDNIENMGDYDYQAQRAAKMWKAYADIFLSVSSCSKIIDVTDIVINTVPVINRIITELDPTTTNGDGLFYKAHQQYERKNKQIEDLIVFENMHAKIYEMGNHFEEFEDYYQEGVWYDPSIRIAYKKDNIIYLGLGAGWNISAIKTLKRLWGDKVYENCIEGNDNWASLRLPKNFNLYFDLNWETAFDELLNQLYKELSIK